MKILTSRLEIRPIKFSEIEEVRVFHNDPNTLKWLTDQRIITRSQQFLWFLRLKRTNKSERWIARSLLNHELISVIRLDQIDFENKNLLIGLDVVSNGRRQKFATEIYESIIPYLFNNYHINRLSMVTLEDNIAAITLYKYLGFKQEGVLRQCYFRNGDFVNGLVFSMLKEESNH